MALTKMEILDSLGAPLWWENCIECNKMVSDQHGDWCVNCGQWVCMKDWGKHRKICLSKKH